MAEDLKATEDFATGKSGEIALKASCPSDSIWIDRRFRLNSAHSKLLAITLSSHTPLDLLTGQIVDTAKALSWENSKEFHHFFPQKFLDKKGIKGDRINSLANIVFLSSVSNKKISASAPSEYLKAVIDSAGTGLDKLLESNLIPGDAFQAALKDDYDQFLRLRAKYIHDKLKALSGW